MDNEYRAEAFISRQAIDPGLRPIARFLPRGDGLHRGLRVPRALMRLASLTVYRRFGSGSESLICFTKSALPMRSPCATMAWPRTNTSAPGAFHAFDLLAPQAPISLAFFASRCRHLRAVLR